MRACPHPFDSAFLFEPEQDEFKVIC